MAETLLKVPAILDPRVVMAVMRATDTSRAISPYSMAVAPDSSFKKFAQTVFKALTSVNVVQKKNLNLMQRR